jgi:uncharacterized protein (TIGR02147 family)
MRKTVFEYTDYRAYLADYYAAQKAANPLFSYQVFARKAGFKDKGFIHSVIHGQKNLSKQSTVKISLALKHSAQEIDYFENLVFFNQSENLAEKKLFFDRLNAFKSGGKEACRILQLHKEQYELCAVWYHAVIRSLLDMAPFRGDFTQLARQVIPPITPKQARQSVELLLKLGLARKDRDGVYRLNEKHLSTGPEIQSIAALNYHKHMTQLADFAISTLPAGVRNITGLTMGISRPAYDRIIREIQDFRAKIIDIVNNDPNAECVYQLNFHLFPLSKSQQPK